MRGKNVRLIIGKIEIKSFNDSLNRRRSVVKEEKYQATCEVFSTGRWCDSGFSSAIWDTETGALEDLVAMIKDCELW